MTNATRFAIVVVLVLLAWVVGYWVAPGAGPAASTARFPATADQHAPTVTFDEDPPVAPAADERSLNTGGAASDDALGGGVGDQPTDGSHRANASRESTDDAGDPLPDDAMSHDAVAHDMDDRGRRGGVVLAPEFYIHTVQQGETPDSISRLYYGTRRHWDVILRANPLDDLHRGLRVGMEIRVPKDPSNVQGRPAGEAAVGERDGRSGRGEDDAGPDPVMEYLEYRVKKNDTLTGIAYEIYGRASLWTLIRDANPKVGDDGRELRAGMTLRIPPKPAE